MFNRVQRSRDAIGKTSARMWKSPAFMSSLVSIVACVMNLFDAFWCYRVGSYALAMFAACSSGFMLGFFLDNTFHILRRARAQEEFVIFANAKMAELTDKLNEQIAKDARAAFARAEQDSADEPRSKATTH